MIKYDAKNHRNYFQNGKKIRAARGSLAPSWYLLHDNIILVRYCHAPSVNTAFFWSKSPRSGGKKSGVNRREAAIFFLLGLYL